jgi:hypothetical protein
MIKRRTSPHEPSEQLTFAPIANCVSSVIAAHLPFALLRPLVRQDGSHEADGLAEPRG